MSLDKKKPSVTVALSALNEEANINNLLDSVLDQIEEGFVLEKVLVISDGSTDRTVEIARGVKDERVVVKDYKERQGQANRLNEAYRELETDILIQTDADVLWKSCYVARDLVRELVSNDRVMMAGGHAEPTPGKTFTEKAIRCTFDAFAEFKTTLKGGHNVFSIHGCILAFKREFIANIQIREKGMGNDIQTYLACIKKGYLYRYAPSAIVYFRLPASLKDHIRQNTRQHEARKRLRDEVDSELLDREYHVPKALYLKSTFSQLMKHPVLTAYIFTINKYCYYKSKFFGDKMDGIWQVSDSTKSMTE